MFMVWVFGGTLRSFCGHMQAALKLSVLKVENTNSLPKPTAHRGLVTASFKGEKKL